MNVDNKVQMKLWTQCWAKVDVGHKILNNDTTFDLCHNNTISAISFFLAQRATTHNTTHI